MITNLLLHVHELPAGRVVVTPIDFPRLSVDSDSYEGARKAVAARVDLELKKTRGSLRGGLAQPESAELDTVELELPEGVAGTGRPRITVSIVVTLRSTSNGEIYIVKAPEIPDVEVAVTERDEAGPAVKKALEEELTHWDLRYVLSCDMVGESRLESIEIILPTTTRTIGEIKSDTYEIDDAAEDLTRLAHDDPDDQFDGRNAILNEVVHTLTLTGRSSVMLVGPSNVGKTALLRQLARLTSTATECDPLFGRRILRISANELIAGSQYTGMWQDRARRLIEMGRSEETIFAMGDPVGIIDAGRWSESDNNLSRVLRSSVESGELTVICECTPEAYAAAQKVEPNFVQAFRRIDVVEPDESTAALIVEAAAERIARREQVSLAPGVVAAAISLTTRFQPYLSQPGKSIRLIDEAVKRMTLDGSVQPLNAALVIKEFERQTGLPPLVLSDEVKFDRDEARRYFEERVLGQEEAVEAMVDLISVVKAGLNDPKKPLGAFFCVGPTGVGKTELAKALAEYLFGSRERMIRFDMGEFASADAVARLVGTKWSRDQEGELTGRVREQPFCVLLLDELEKANGGVFDVLLSALGEGRLTDASGRMADFHNAIIMMTSNLGADGTQTRLIGFTESDAKNEAERLRTHFVERAQKFFKPEFYNRIDQVIAFRPLDRETVRKIARRELGRLLDRQGIVTRQLLVEIDDAVVDAMASSGFDPKYGARPLQRQIERSVIQPLARLINSKRPGPGDLIRLVMDEGEVDVALRRLAIAALAARRAGVNEHDDDRVNLSSASSLRRIKAVQERFSSDEAAQIADELKTERSELVERANRPGFWDEPELAKQTLARLYQTERAVERFEGLSHRLSGLGELARQLSRNRDNSRQKELRRALAEVEAEFTVVRLELVGAVAGSVQGAATVRVVAIGGASEWADTLMHIYSSWASRSGREAEMVADRAVRIAGLSSYDLLKREAGLHRQVNGDDEALARVLVSPEDTDDCPTNGDVTDEVVRVYSKGKNQFVRDPRTGVRVGDVGAVLCGRIDDFLVGDVRQLG